MTCTHCGTDHTVEESGWPDNWDHDRRERFVKSMESVGVVTERAPAMAVQVEKLSEKSPYVVSEIELLAYLSQSADISKRLSRINDKRDHCLAWSRRITRPLTFKIADDKVSICAKLLILAIIGLPMLVLTAPIRLPFSVWKWWVGRSFHPYFTGWLDKHGVKKQFLN